MQDLRHVQVLFDLDGTFIDTAADLTAALNHAIVADGLPPFSTGEAKHFVGKGVAFMIRRAFSATGRPLSEARLESLSTRLLEHYTANIARHSRPFPGAVEAAQALKARGARIGICTNKRIDLTRQLLRALELLDLFDAVTGGNSFEIHKPDPEHLRRTFALMQPPPDSAPAQRVMVGDTVNDFAAAKGAPALAVGVTFGYGSPEDLAESQVLIDHFDELAPLIERMPQTA